MSAPEAQARAKTRDAALRRSFMSSGITRLITLALSVGALAVASRGLDVERFGVFSVIYSASLIATMADLGVGSSIVTCLSRADGQDRRSDMRSYVASAAMLMSASGLLVVVVLGAVSTIFDLRRVMGVEDIAPGELAAATWTAVVCLGLTLPFSLGQCIDIALQRGSRAMFWMMLGAAATLLGCLACSVAGAPLWLWVLALVGGPALAFGVQTLSVLGRGSDLGGPPRLCEATRSTARELLLVAGPYFVIGLSSVVTMQSGVLVLSHEQGAGAAGILGLSVRLFGVVTTTLTVSTRQFWPAAAEAFAAGHADWVRTRFRQVLLTATVLGIAGAGGLLVLGRPLIRAWAGPSLVPSWGLLVLGAAVAVYVVIMTQVSYLLNAAGLVREQAGIGLATMVVTVVMTVLLTGPLGLMGPYAAILVANLTLGLLPLIVLSRRVLRGEVGA